MSGTIPPGAGTASSEELARYSLAQQEQRARIVKGRQLAMGLSGSRAARQALGERMAAVTRGNNADDRNAGLPHDRRVEPTDG